jgi:hypothetical protein
VKIVKLWNPDNLPVENILVYGNTAVALPTNAEVLFNDDTHLGKTEPRPHILVGDKEYKLCSTCHRWVRVWEFYKDKKNWDGLQYSCADCIAKSRRLIYLRYREAISLQNKEKYFQKKLAKVLI